MAWVRSSLAWRMSPDKFNVNCQVLVRSHAFHLSAVGKQAICVVHDYFTLHSQRMDWGFEWVENTRELRLSHSVSGKWEMDWMISKNQLEVNGFGSYLSCCHYPHFQRPSDTQFAWVCHTHCTAPEERINKKKIWIPGTNCCVILWCRNEMFNLSIKTLHFSPQTNVRFSVSR